MRPAIVEIVGAQWLQRLDQHNRDGGAEETDRDDAGDDIVADRSIVDESMDTDNASA